MENMQKILDKLAEALNLTRAGHGSIRELRYVPETELVEVYFDNSTRPGRVINVAMDSGYAMIKDVVKYIDIG